MPASRFKRYEEKTAKKRTLFALLGSIGVLLFIAFFGVKILVGFSLLIDKLRGSSTAQTSPAIGLIQAPTLNPIPEATNSATLTITGNGAPSSSIVLFINGNEYETLQTDKDGVFLKKNIPLDPGRITFMAKQVGNNNVRSAESNSVSTIVDQTPPELMIMSPEEGATTNDPSRKILVTGETDADTRVTINDRFVVVSQSGSFRYQMPLSSGDNTLKIIATDPAGNQTTIERHVRFSE